MNKYALTIRQDQILQELCKGHSNKQIARILNIAEATVKVHLTSVFIKLNVTTRIQAMMKTLQEQHESKTL